MDKKKGTEMKTFSLLNEDDDSERDKAITGKQVEEANSREKSQWTHFFLQAQLFL